MSYKLEKPYKQSQKNDFIINYNRRMGLRIEESITALYALEAWEELVDDEVVSHKEEWDIEQLALTKEAKVKEASDKAKSAVENGYVIYKEAQFETNTQTLSDLGDERNICLTLGQKSTIWLSKDDQAVELILDDVDTVNNDDIFKIGLLAKQFKNQIWTERYVGYLHQITAAETVEEVNAIEISYEPNTLIEP